MVHLTIYLRAAYADFEQTWDIPLLSTCFKVPGLFCYAFFCPCCMAYQQRSRLLGMWIGLGGTSWARY